MRLLFIKLKHIGDALILTPTLTATRRQYPDAQIWVVVRKGCEGILQGCTAIDRILTAASPEKENRSVSGIFGDLQLIRELRRQHFDYAFELSDGDRGRWLATLSGSTHRVTTGFGKPLSRWWKSRFTDFSNFLWLDKHRVEKDFHTVSDVFPLGAEIPPLNFDTTRMTPWPPATGLNRFALLHPGTRWQRKRWPIERWIETANQLLQKVDHLVISTGPAQDELEDARAILNAVGDRAIATEGRASWSELAHTLRRAALFVGVDTAVMHLAAACGTPSVALFGPSMEHAWHPWKTRYEIITSSQVPMNIRSQAYFDAVEARPMHDIPAQAVLAACDRLLRVG